MKEYLRDLIRGATDPLHARLVMREYLQARILSCLQSTGAMVPLAFHGGTALRFLFNIQRYSEDIDFALEGNAESYSLRRYMRAIHSDLTAEDYPIEVKINEQHTVQSALIRFRGLYRELGVSDQTDEVLMIKVEVDTNPPSGAGLDTTIIRRYTLLRLQHHDRASLLSGKLHAILQRPYVKGRDIYDLLWYLSAPNWPSPNLVMLNNALNQNDWQGDPVTEYNWRSIVLQRLMTVNWPKAVNDVRPFLMNRHEIDMLSLEVFTDLLSG